MVEVSNYRTGQELQFITTTQVTISSNENTEGLRKSLTTNKTFVMSFCNGSENEPTISTLKFYTLHYCVYILIILTALLVELKIISTV